MSEKRSDLLIWVDCEFTGLNIQTDKILEACAVITDNNLRVIAQSPVYVVHQSQEILDRMDNWNKKHHAESGLLAAVVQSQLLDSQVDTLLYDFCAQYCVPQTAPLCGNSVYQDRCFLKLYMPLFEHFAHYRIIDVSSIKELVKRWYPNIPEYKKKKAHRACDDIYESIDELLWYKQNLFKIT